MAQKKNYSFFIKQSNGTRIMNTFLSIDQPSFTDHPFFDSSLYDSNSFDNSALIDVVPSHSIICSYKSLKNVNISCFKCHDELILSLIENDPEEPLIFVPLPSSLFNQFAYEERISYLSCNKLNFMDDGDSVYFVSINPNGFITGEWFEASLDQQGYFGDRDPGLKAGYTNFVLDIFNCPDGIKPNNCFIPEEYLQYLPK